MQVFVDESKSNAYILAAVIVAPGNAASLRKSIAKLLMPGQGYIHFVNESSPRRKAILSAFEKLQPRVRIYVCQGASHITARAICFEALLNDFVELGVTTLIIERDDALLKSDELVVREGLYKRGLKPKVEFRHVGKSDEPIVWIADAMAWSFARGDDFRRRALKLIESVNHISR